MAEENWLRKLSKSEDDKWIGGVCGGFGKYTPIPSWLWRVIFCVTAFFWGMGIVIYILLWIFMPKGPAQEHTHEKTRFNCCIGKERKSNEEQNDGDRNPDI